MSRFARDIAARIGVDRAGPVRSAYRSVEFARYFARGYRWASAIPDAATEPPREQTVPNELEALAVAHESGPGIFKWQHYFDVYDRHLARFRGGEVHLVEIGIYGGGSLGLWRSYLGPDSHVYGVDIDPGCSRFAGEGIEVAIGDQSDRDFWRGFIEAHPKIDVVIDDGGHEPEQQAVSIECLLPAVAPGGVYICEDIHGPFQPFHAFVDGLTRPLSDIIPAGTQARPANALQGQVASVHNYPILTVIEKTPWRTAGFEPMLYGTEWPHGLGTQAGDAST
jgi:hypothetical protein